MRGKLLEVVHAYCTVQELINWCRRNRVRPKEAKLSVNSFGTLVLLTDEIDIVRNSPLRKPNETA